MKTLTWKVDKTVPVSCPDYQVDPYTGECPSTHCLVYHCEMITESKTAEFVSEEEAKDFVAKAPLSCYDFKLDGVQVGDKKERTGITTSGFGNLSTTDTGTVMILN